MENHDHVSAEAKPCRQHLGVGGCASFKQKNASRAHTSAWAIKAPLAKVEWMKRWERLHSSVREQARLHEAKSTRICSRG
jgi:hypothetical protein